MAKKGADFGDHLPGLIVLVTDPMPAVRPLIKHFRGTEIIEPDELAHCALHLLGCGLSLVHDHQHVRRGDDAAAHASHPDLRSDEAKAALLERCFPESSVQQQQQQGGQAAGAVEIPWDLILMLARQLLEMWLSSR